MRALSEGSATWADSDWTRHSMAGTGQPFTSQENAIELPVLLVMSSGGDKMRGTRDEAKWYHS